MGRAKNKYFYLLLSTVAISSCGFFNRPNVNMSNRDVNQFFELASKEKVAREQELGKASAVKAKPKKDFDILLSDKAVSQKWGMSLTDSRRAWKAHRAMGDRSIVVAVIDTGIDINHPDLKNNLWVNKKEKFGKPGVDDDGNGYIDDIHGWNFVGQDNNLTDNHGHGTHIAGIIGAERGFGVAPRVSLMALKYYDPKAFGNNNLMNTVRALKYAVDMNVDIINYSGGGLEPSEAEQKLIQEAHRKGILVVAAAGNESANSDKKAYYPADYDIPNIISVTAIDQGKNVLSSSNYGENSVDIAAPGNNIYSTLPGGKYGYMTGTSQATAFATGVAVLLKARFSDFSARQIVKHITETGDLDPRLVGKTRYNKRLNTYRALAILDQNVGVTGVVAANAANIDHRAFTTSDELREQVFQGEFDNNLGGIGELNQVMQALVRENQPRKGASNVDSATTAPQL